MYSFNFYPVGGSDYFTYFTNEITEALALRLLTQSHT